MGRDCLWSDFILKPLLLGLISVAVLLSTLLSLRILTVCWPLLELFRFSLPLNQRLWIKGFDTLVKLFLSNRITSIWWVWTVIGLSLDIYLNAYRFWLLDYAWHTQCNINCMRLSQSNRCLACKTYFFLRHIQICILYKVWPMFRPIAIGLHTQWSLNND